MFKQACFTWQRDSLAKMIDLHTYLLYARWLILDSLVLKPNQTIMLVSNGGEPVCVLIHSDNFISHLKTDITVPESDASVHLDLFKGSLRSTASMNSVSHPNDSPQRHR